MLCSRGAVPVSEQQEGDTVDDEGDDPGEDDGVDGGNDGPFPAAAFVLDGDEGGYAGEIQQDEYHEGECCGRSGGPGESVLQHGVPGDGLIGHTVRAGVHRNGLRGICGGIEIHSRGGRA